MVICKTKYLGTGAPRHLYTTKIIKRTRTARLLISQWQIAYLPRALVTARLVITETRLAR